MSLVGAMPMCKPINMHRYVKRDKKLVYNNYYVRKLNAVPRLDAELVELQLDAPWAAYMLVIIPMPPFARS